MGSWVFLVLSIMQFLVGGALVIDLAIITFFVALGINKHLHWWRRKLTSRSQSVLRAIWPWSMLFYFLTSLVLLLITVFGIDNEALLEKTMPLAGFMFAPIIFIILGGVAVDIKAPVK